MILQVFVAIKIPMNVGNILNGCILILANALCEPREVQRALYLPLHAGERNISGFSVALWRLSGSQNVSRCNLGE